MIPERIRRAVDRDGRLLLFYETPSADSARHAVARLVDALRANGFAPKLRSCSPTLVACVAHAA